MITTMPTPPQTKRRQTERRHKNQDPDPSGRPLHPSDTSHRKPDDHNLHQYRTQSKLNSRPETTIRNQRSNTGIQHPRWKAAHTADRKTPQKKTQPRIHRVISFSCRE
jgi:hypothetical protein